MKRSFLSPGNFLMVFAFVGFVTTGNLFAKDEKLAKVKWKDVKIAETEPAGCTFLEKLDVDSGTWMTFSGKGFKEKSAKKVKKAAGKIGANVVFITKETMIGSVMNREANAYLCK